MLMSLLVAKVFGGGLTCSETMAILMDQPTKPEGRSIESHAHMHMMEGFRLDPRRFGGDGFSFERKRAHWENPTHLLPSGSEADFGRYVYASGTSGRDHGVYHGVFQDPDRLPPDRAYANRTGLGALPRVTKDTYTVYRVVSGGPPIAEQKTLAQLGGLTVGKNPGDYMAKSAKEPTVLRVRTDTTVEVPAVAESPAHTMFPDSESMVMHLTAALLSDAGRIVVRHLFWNIRAGEQRTVGIFSKTAVRAVERADPRVPVRMIERALEVDTSARRDPVTGFYPATGRVRMSESAIDHVVVVLGHRETGQLNVLTCFPSEKTTGDSIGTATAPTEDIAELQFGTHTKVIQTNPIPVLRW
jgi:hypothetical protein